MLAPLLEYLMKLLEETGRILVTNREIGGSRSMCTLIHVARIQAAIVQSAVMHLGASHRRARNLSQNLVAQTEIKNQCSMPTTRMRAPTSAIRRSTCTFIHWYSNVLEAPIRMVPITKSTKKMIIDRCLTIEPSIYRKVYDDAGML